MTTALLLIAHGSRNAEANDDLRYLADELRRRASYAIVETAFLELAAPTIPEGGERCVVHGADRVILLPYFLSAGVHVRDDLRRHGNELATRHPNVEFVLAEPLGRHPLLVDVVLERARSAKPQAAQMVNPSS